MHEICGSPVYPSVDWATLSVQPLQISAQIPPLLSSYWQLNIVVLTDTPDKSELRNEIRLLQSEGSNAAEIQRRRNKVLENNGENLMILGSFSGNVKKKINCANRCP